MAFQEKSAWFMSLGLLVVSITYFHTVYELSVEVGAVVPPNVGYIIEFTVLLIILAVVSHIVIAIFSPKDANQRLDERERRIFDRAGHISGVVLGVGVVTFGGHYLLHFDGNALFYGLFASLLVSQLSEYGVRIALYHRAG